ncbi:MAG: hypothetical protein R3C53_09570 [Pirellulaceae bacterium]
MSEQRRISELAGITGSDELADDVSTSVWMLNCALILLGWLF